MKRLMKKLFKEADLYSVHFALYSIFLVAYMLLLYYVFCKNSIYAPFVSGVYNLVSATIVDKFITDNDKPLFETYRLMTQFGCLLGMGLLFWKYNLNLDVLAVFGTLVNDALGFGVSLKTIKTAWNDHADEAWFSAFILLALVLLYVY